MSQVLSFLFSLESDKALAELCRLLLIRIFLCFPSHHPWHIHHPPRAVSPFPDHSASGKLSSFKPPLQTDGGKKREKRKETRQRDLSHQLWEPWNILPLVRDVSLPWRCFGQGLRSPSPVHPPRLTCSKEQCKFQMASCTRGTSKAFWVVAEQAAALTPSKGTRCKEALREDSEQSNFKQQRC